MKIITLPFVPSHQGRGNLLSPLSPCGRGLGRGWKEMVFLDVDKKGQIVFIQALYKSELNSILDGKVYKVEKADI